MPREDILDFVCRLIRPAPARDLVDVGFHNTKSRAKRCRRPSSTHESEKHVATLVIQVTRHSFYITRVRGTVAR